MFSCHRYDLAIELAAAEWVIRKCKLYLMDLPQLHNGRLENPKIKRLKERSSSYIFAAVTRKGKDMLPRMLCPERQ